MATCYVKVYTVISTECQRKLSHIVNKIVHYPGPLPVKLPSNPSGGLLTTDKVQKVISIERQRKLSHIVNKIVYYPGPLPAKLPSIHQEGF